MNELFQPISRRELQDLLQALAEVDAFVFLETARSDQENRYSYLFQGPVAHLACRAVDELERFFAELELWLARGYYLAGWLAYEFGYLLEEIKGNRGIVPGEKLAEFGVYRSPQRYDHGSGRWDQRPGIVERGLVSTCGPKAWRLANLRFSQERDEYLARIERIKEYITAGDTYQVNYTLKLLFDFEGSVADLYETLRNNQSVSYGALLKHGSRQIISFSPELFFRKQGEICLARPMKGTSRRGASRESDQLVRTRLAADLKNRSENVMIVDLLRNDLGRLCRMGTVKTSKLFTVETYETLHQMTSTIEGRLRPGVTWPELFRAIFPCGSVTGAPKIRTMEIIRELETVPRGVYTGAIGFIAPSGDAVFNVPIRTVVLDGRRGEMGIGSGIVADSDAEAEWEECRLKARFLVDPEEEFQLLETILWHPDLGFWLLERHLSRLADSAEYWGFPCRRESLVEELERLVQEETGVKAGRCLRIRLLLYKDGTISVVARDCAMPVMPEIALASPGGRRMRVALATEPVAAEDPFLRHKTTRRKMYEDRRNKAEGAGCFEALLINQRGELTEGTFTNLFVLKGRELLTPPLTCGLLNGVLRQAMLVGELPLPAGMTIRETVLYRADLDSAEAIYVGNSIRGLLEVELVALV
jgi:para-aminobenzoate synthetase / 4-amino-4-deoxychorismate lyase